MSLTPIINNGFKGDGFIIKKFFFLTALALMLAALSGCVPMDGTYSPEKLAGFFAGLWHGIIWLITFIMGIFTDGKYTIYETYNNGWPYNLGFLIGIGAFFGGGGSFIHIKTCRD